MEVSFTYKKGFFVVAISKKLNSDNNGNSKSHSSGQNLNLEKFLLFLLTFLAGFIYLFTLAPSVGPGDSGELTTVAYTLGMAHPPGYPLYTMLGKLFTFLPMGSVAYRMNFMTALFQVGAVIFLYLFLNNLFRRPWLSFLASGLFAFSPLVWRYTVVAEVFTLNNLFVCALLYLGSLFEMALKNDQGKAYRFLLVGSLLSGLSMAHHHISFFVIFPLIVWAFWRGRSFLFSWEKISGLFLLFLLGLTPYFYLVWVGEKMPLISWGNTSTFKGLWSFFLRKDFGTFNLGSLDKAHGGILKIKYFFREIPKEFFLVGILFPILGMIKIVRQKKWDGLLFLTFFIFIFYTLIFHFLANFPLERPLYLHVHSRFWIQSLIFLFIFLVPGIIWCEDFLSKKFATKNINKSSLKYKELLPVMVLSLVFLQVIIHYKKEDQSSNKSIYYLGKNVLDTLPEGALFLSLGDIYTNAVRYMQQAENYRKDVIVIDRELIKKFWQTRVIKKFYPQVNFPGLYYRPGKKEKEEEKGKGYHLGELIAVNINRFPIYMAHFKREGKEAEDKRWQKIFFRLPYGLVHKVFPKEETLNFNKYIKESNISLENVRPDRLEKVYPGYWEYLVWKDFVNAPYFRARQLMYILNKGKTKNQKFVKKVIPLLEQVERTHPKPPWELHKMLGAAYSWLKDKKVYHVKRMIASWDRYIQLAPEDENDLAQIKETAQAYKDKFQEHLKRQKKKSKK